MKELEKVMEQIKKETNKIKRHETERNFLLRS